jgi:hypothetical protein
MAFTDYIPLIGTVNKVIDLGSEAILDKDMKAKFDAAAAELKQQAYLAELKTETIPWVDGLHKLMRPLSSVLAQIICFIIAMYSLKNNQPEVALWAVAGGAAPQSIYNAVKGKGNREK